MPDCSPPKRWLTPNELVTIGFERARVVMMNEAHNGLRRAVRTREIGRGILPTAHAAGARHLAMEALFPVFEEEANATRSLPEIPGRAQRSRSGGLVSESSTRARSASWPDGVGRAQSDRCSNRYELQPGKCRPGRSRSL